MACFAIATRHARPCQSYLMLRNWVIRNRLFVSKAFPPDMIWGAPSSASERLVRLKCFRILLGRRVEAYALGGTCVLRHYLLARIPLWAHKEKQGQWGEMLQLNSIRFGLTLLAGRPHRLFGCEAS